MEYPVITYTANPGELNIDKSEVLRYLGYRTGKVSGEETEQISAMIEESVKHINPVACYRRFDIEILENNRISFPYGVIESRHLSLNLEGCQSIYMLAATIGVHYDRLMMRERVSSMARAAVFQAIGATAVEAFTDKLCDHLGKIAQNNNEKLRNRFSPGYGDYGLSHQIGLFKFLMPEKYAGITLNTSLVMSPEKSITAVTGIEKCEL